jgi:hypothetical protein
LKALAGLTALAVFTAGSVLLARPPGATPRVATIEVVESQFDDAPPSINLDPSDWR